MQKIFNEIGMNYEDTAARLGSEERVLRFLKLFLQDESYKDFCRFMEEKNYQDAFRSIHTLKGVCMNLGFTDLLEVSSKITERLRREDIEKTKELIPQLSLQYKKTCKAIECCYTE